MMAQRFYDYMETHGITEEDFNELAEEMGITPLTLRYRIEEKKGESLTLGQIALIQCSLEMTGEDVDMIFFQWYEMNLCT